MPRSIALCLLLALCVAPAWAQRGPGNQQDASHTDNTVYLAGRVVMQDGSAPPDLVAMERACGGRVFSQGYTTVDGTFTLRIGSNTAAAMDDAGSAGVDFRGRPLNDTLNVGGLTGDTEQFSEMKNKGSVDLTGCELRASLDGYRANPIMLTRRNIFDNPEVGNMVLRPITESSGRTVSATSLQAPKAARKSYQKALKEMQRRSPPDKVAAELDNAVAAYPAYAEAWAVLGDVRIGMGDEAGARQAFLSAIEADPEYFAPYPSLIKLDLRSGDWASAAERSRTYISLNPVASEERFFLAMSLVELGRLDEADAALDDILRDPEFSAALPQARQLQGSVDSRRGDYAAAADHYRDYLAAAPKSPAAAEVQRQLDEWKTLGVIE